MAALSKIVQSARASVFRLSIVLGFFLPFGVVDAYVPTVVTQQNLHDVYEVRDIAQQQAFYGFLDGFPHTYTATVGESATLTLEILVPDTAASENTISGIVVRSVEGSGRVSEVARLHAKGSSWERFYERWGGDWYRRGPTTSIALSPGTYRIEVSTPDNRGEPYVLRVGTNDTWGDVGYGEMLSRIGEVKVFFGKSRIRIIESPLVYVPLMLVGLVALAWFLYRRFSIPAGSPRAPQEML